MADTWGDLALWGDLDTWWSPGGTAPVATTRGLHRLLHPAAPDHRLTAPAASGHTLTAPARASHRTTGG